MVTYNLLIREMVRRENNQKKIVSTAGDLPPWNSTIPCGHSGRKSKEYAPSLPIRCRHPGCDTSRQCSVRWRGHTPLSSISHNVLYLYIGRTGAAGRSRWLALNNNSNLVIHTGRLPTTAATDSAMVNNVGGRDPLFTDGPKHCRFSAMANSADAHARSISQSAISMDARPSAVDNATLPPSGPRPPTGTKGGRVSGRSAHRTAGIRTTAIDDNTSSVPSC